MWGEKKEGSLCLGSRSKRACLIAHRLEVGKVSRKRRRWKWRWREEQAKAREGRQGKARQRQGKAAHPIMFVPGPKGVSREYSSLFFYIF